MDQFFSYIHWMMSRIGNCIKFPDYTSDKLNKTATAMAQNLEYNIGKVAYSSFHTFSSARMELPFFSNTHTMWNVMDRAWTNSTILTFKRFVI